MLQAKRCCQEATPSLGYCIAVCQGPFTPPWEAAGAAHALRKPPRADESLAWINLAISTELDHDRLMFWIQNMHNKAWAWSLGDTTPGVCMVLESAWVSLSQLVFGHVNRHFTRKVSQISKSVTVTSEVALGPPDSRALLLPGWSFSFTKPRLQLSFLLCMAAKQKLESYWAAPATRGCICPVLLLQGLGWVQSPQNLPRLPLCCCSTWNSDGGSTWWQGEGLPTGSGAGPNALR